MESCRKIDAYTHFASEKMVAYIEQKTRKPMVFKELFSKIKTLTDVNARIAFMDKFGIDAHCLIPLPWLESSPEVYSSPEWAAEAARICNTHFAELAQQNKGRFYVAALVPTTNQDVMMAEAIYALQDLSMDGLALFCGPTVKPLDDPIFDPLWNLAEALDKPIWLHPCRPQFIADYEAYSQRGSQFQIWNTLGWIYDTSVAMVHIAAAGIFKRHPSLKIVTHHHGGMIPFFIERFETQTANFNDGSLFLEDMHHFYCDTATFGENALNIQQAINFFGKDKVLFGTDTPMDMSKPGFFTECGIRSIEKLNLSNESSELLFWKNCHSMLTSSRDKVPQAGGVILQQKDVMLLPQPNLKKDFKECSAKAKRSKL